MGADKELIELAALGKLAGGVAHELAAPLARVHATLGAAVSQLDRFFAASKGPDPLPLSTAIQVRERVADAYLDVARAARLAGDLAVAVAGKSVVGEVDVNEVVDRAVILARHGITQDGEILVDLGAPPLVRADGARLAQALAHLVLQGAGSGSVIIRTRAAGGQAVITVQHGDLPGEGVFAGLVASVIAGAGGTVSRVDGVTEVRLPSV